MPRKLRIEYDGAIYHVMNRGGRREPIFRDDADRERFLETLAEACATGFSCARLAGPELPHRQPIVCAGIVPDPLQTFEPVAWPTI